MRRFPTIIFVNRFASPDLSATSQMLNGIASGLAARGYPVAIIASRQRYDRPAEGLPAFERLGGVEIHRVATTRFGRAGLPGRAVDYLTFYLAATLKLMRLGRRGDVVVVKTDPPLLSVVIAPLARLRGIALVNWLQDIFPEVAERLNVGGSTMRPFFAVARRLRDWSLIRARKNVVLGQRMAQYLIARGIPIASLVPIPNWADDATIAPASRDTGLRRDLGLGSSFVVAYSGNLGRAHEIETCLGAIEALANRTRPASPDLLGAAGARCPDIQWLFIGGGALTDELKARTAAIAAAGAAPAVHFHPYVPAEQLAEALATADVHLISLRSEMEGLIVPSKMYGIAAAGRAAIFVGDATGEVARELASADAGVVCTIGDGAALAAQIIALAEDPARCEQLGRNARALFEARFTREAAVDKWEHLLRSLSSEH